MKSRTRRLVSALLAGGVVLLWGVRSHDDVAAAQKGTDSRLVVHSLEKP